MKIDVSKFCNFEGLTEIEIGQNYQYKEGSIIFDFKLFSFVNDGQYLYILGELDEKVQKKYGIDRLDLTLSVENVYYSGMIRIMPVGTYGFV